MKTIIVIVMTLVFVLGIAGLGFSAEKTTFAMNHGDSAVCNIPNCCAGHVNAKETVTTKKLKESTQWSLTFREALQRNGLDVPSDQ